MGNALATYWVDTSGTSYTYTNSSTTYEFVGSPVLLRSLDDEPDHKLTKDQVNKRNQERNNARIRALVERIKLSQPPDKVPEPAQGPADFEEI